MTAGKTVSKVVDFIVDVSSENHLAKHSVHVHKFGGSSLATSKCILRVVNIIRQHCQLNDIVVVSANGKTTDRLFAFYSLVEQQYLAGSSKDDTLISEASAALAQEQVQLITELLSKNNAHKLTYALQQDIKQLTTWISTDLAKHRNDILAFGEVWSARLLSALLNEQVCPSNNIDARDFLIINNENDCEVDYPQSEESLRTFRQSGKLAVITGYISKDEQGNSCTLGRNGSDYSATIFASLTSAKNVTLWTDVDGIYSADPRVVPNARKLHRLPNGVAKELGRLGNPVLHANTLLPLINPDSDHHTHLHVASSFDSEIIGTEIGKFGHIAKQELSVTYLNDLLVTQSESFKGETNTNLIRSLSPICYDSQTGTMVIKQEQQKALSQMVAAHNTEITFKPISIIATVGHKASTRGDIKARFKRSLKTAKPLNILTSENTHSLIALLPEPCSIELLNKVHHSMTKDARHIGLVVAGIGNIGERFLELLPAQLNNVYALEHLHLVGLLSSTKALINNDGIDVTQAASLFSRDAQAYDNEQLLTWLANHPYDDLIVVDITASESFSLMYEQMFELGIHVIGANKWAASSDSEHYNKLVNLADSNQCLWKGNTTVGAGLPINHAIEDLRKSGDMISEISGIFSGTLSWLFETYDGSSQFSELLLDAQKQGITEPDPREDLSGRDVQRKLLILARKAGFDLSLADIDCQNLVPDNLQALSTDEFLSKAHELDSFFANELANATAEGACIRYVARFQSLTTSKEGAIACAKVSLEVLSKVDAFANLTPGDNIFQITSQWYQNNPLIIRGPGAGRDVTAGGLHSDLVNVCQQLCHKQTQVKIKGIN